jgi:molecular chaperone IbpA
MMIGFGDKVNSFRTFPRQNSGFPFYNVVKIDEDTFGIEIAVAGFSEDDIEISEHNSSLVVSGKQGDDSREYLHKGISAKSFARTFALAEHVHVTSARLKNGMLQIALKREIPEEKKPRHITIGS